MSRSFHTSDPTKPPKLVIWDHHCHRSTRIPFKLKDNRFLPPSLSQSYHIPYQSIPYNPPSSYPALPAHPFILHILTKEKPNLIPPHHYPPPTTPPHHRPPPHSHFP